MLNEIWHDTFHGMIPKEQYALYLNHSDEGGLVIRLEGLRYCVTLDFGITHAVNVLDEGVLLVDLPGVESPNEAQLRQNGYPSTLYLIENGLYTTLIQTRMTEEIYEAFRLRQYNLVTANYLVEIICSMEPVVTVSEN